MDSSTDETIESIMKDLADTDKRLHEVEGRSTATILIGLTGAGKSTLLNLLAQKKLKSFKKGTMARYEADDPLPTSKISHKVVSETPFPSYWEGYWDFPGYGDTRGSKKEILNAYSMFHITQKFKKSVRVVVVVSENTLDDSKLQNFRELLKVLELSFKCSQGLSSGFIFIITFARSKKEQLLEQFKIILEDNRHTLESYEIRILEDLATSRIHSQYSPYQKKMECACLTKKNRC